MQGLRDEGTSQVAGSVTVRERFKEAERLLLSEDYAELEVRLLAMGRTREGFKRMTGRLPNIDERVLLKIPCRSGDCIYSMQCQPKHGCAILRNFEKDEPMYLQDDDRIHRIIRRIAQETDQAKLRIEAERFAKMARFLVAVMEGKAEFEIQWRNWNDPDKWFRSECGSWEKCTTWVKAKSSSYHAQRIVVGHIRQTQIVVWPEEAFGDVATGAVG